jgi:hypothetical protein
MYKYLRFANGSQMLVDPQTDPTEQVDIAGEHAAKLRFLSARLDNYSAAAAPCWGNAVAGLDCDAYPPTLDLPAPLNYGPAYSVCEAFSFSYSYGDGPYELT